MLKKWISFASSCSCWRQSPLPVPVLAASQVHPNTEDAYVAGDVFSVSSRIAGTLSTVEVTENQPVRRGQLIATMTPRLRCAGGAAKAALDEARFGPATTARRSPRPGPRRTPTGANSRWRASTWSASPSCSSATPHPNSVTTTRSPPSRSLPPTRPPRRRRSRWRKPPHRRRATREAPGDPPRQRRTDPSYCTITSPVDGLVSRKSAEPGQVVAPGQPLCAVVPLEGEHV